MNKSEKFWNKIAKRYSKQPIADEASYQKKLQVTREYLKPDMEVLEFGCGTGSTAIIHAPYVKHIRAIDISSKMIEIAQDKADTKKIDNITFGTSTIEGLSAQEQTLDVVLGFSILHLLENKEEVLANIYKMLKPGGLFVSSTMCMGDTMRWLEIITPIGKLLGLMPLVKFFTKIQGVSQLDFLVLTGNAYIILGYEFKMGHLESPRSHAPRGNACENALRSLTLSIGTRLS